MVLSGIHYDNQCMSVSLWCIFCNHDEFSEYCKSTYLNAVITICGAGLTFTREGINKRIPYFLFLHIYLSKDNDDHIPQHIFHIQDNVDSHVLFPSISYKLCKISFPFHLQKSSQLSLDILDSQEMFLHMQIRRKNKLPYQYS